VFGLVDGPGEQPGRYGQDVLAQVEEMQASNPRQTSTPNTIDSCDGASSGPAVVSQIGGTIFESLIGDGFDRGSRAGRSPGLYPLH
jgi:hypothetical protein